MKYPFLNTISKSRNYQTSFLGYNHTENCKDGEFFDMKNLSSDLYPVLSTRRNRGVYNYPSGQGNYKAKVLIVKDALCYVSGNKFYINNNAVLDFDIPAVVDEKGNEKEITLVSMGAYVVIFPQMLYLNTANREDRGSLNAEHAAKKVDFSLAKADGTDYGALSTEKPEVDENGNPKATYYLDTTTTPNVVRQYSETSKSWTPVPTTYVKISTVGIDQKFQVGDGIKISGIDNEDLSHLNGANVIQSIGEGYITITGIISKSFVLDLEGSEGKEVLFSRKAPEMDFVVESQNRLWGCKYGFVDGKTVNEIYACKLGDFKNWNCFAGISSDSYAASVGSDGFFTGAITFQGNPIFFKENCLHKVFGTVPANYQIQETACNGVQKGSGRSLAIVNNVLFYKGNNGVYSYDGSLPVFASPEFGLSSYDSAVAGGFGNKYYISMRDVDRKKYVMFVYDRQKGLWHKEDELFVKQFVSDGNNVYFLSDDDKIHTIFGDSSTGKRFGWFAETGVIGKESPDKKILKKITARVKLPPGSRILFFAEYDSFGGWQYLFSMESRTMQTFSVPIRINRCDHFRLRIEGTGEAQIHSISKTLQEGSDR